MICLLSIPVLYQHHSLCLPPCCLWPPRPCAVAYSILIHVTVYAPAIIVAHAVSYLSCSLFAILINPSRAISKYLIMKLLSICTISYQLQLKFFWEEYRIKKNNALLSFQNIISLNTLHKLLFLTGLDRTLERETQAAAL